MRDIHTSAITDAVKKLSMEANWNLEPDMLRAFDRVLGTERSAAGRQGLQTLKENAELARTKRIPYCQDTGFVVCFGDFRLHRTWVVYADDFALSSLRLAAGDQTDRSSPFPLSSTGGSGLASFELDLTPKADPRGLKGSERQANGSSDRLCHQGYVWKVWPGDCRSSLLAPRTVDHLRDSARG